MESPPEKSAGELFPPQTVFDYNRTIIGYHGTRKDSATSLIDGEPFDQSQNDDDWLGHGIYFWEHAPQQAWTWARQRYGTNHAAVIGAMIRLGRCLDLLDPSNISLLKSAQADLRQLLGVKLPKNMNSSKYLDCAVFNYLYAQLDVGGWIFESCRAVFVPNYTRVWNRSGVFEGGHIQVCLREPRNILAVWSVKQDGSYGKDP